MREKSGRVRVTMHRGRKGKYGVYSPKHNDRNFDVQEASHIDPTKQKDNRYWHCYSKEQMTFEEVEKRFYSEYFTEALEAQNARYKKNRHRERIQTMDEYRMSDRHCVQEVLMQLGTHDQERPSHNTLIQIVNDFLAWERKTFSKGNARIRTLNLALHLDEPDAADHIHKREVFMWKNSSGNWEVNQERCLEALGIERPNPSKAKGQYNNRKQTFTKMCREKFIEIAKGYGIDIETEPKETSRSGLGLLEYKRQQEEERLAAIQAQIKEAELDPRLQNLKAIERDKLLKVYYPEIWKQLDEIVSAPIVDLSKKKPKKANRDYDLDR